MLCSPDDPQRQLQATHFDMQSQRDSTFSSVVKPPCELCDLTTSWQGAFLLYS